MAPKGRRAKLRALLDELETEAAERSYEAHLERRAAQEAASGRPIRGRRPTPDSAAHRSRQQANTTDPDNRLLKTNGCYIQGYNAQAAATRDQVIVAATVSNGAQDAPEFAPVIASTKSNLRRAGVRGRVRTVVADAGYWSNDNVNTRGVEAIIAPGKGAGAVHAHPRRWSRAQPSRSVTVTRMWGGYPIGGGRGGGGRGGL